MTKTIKKEKAGMRIGRQLLAGKIMLPFSKSSSKAKRVIREVAEDIKKDRDKITNSDDDSSDSELIFGA